MKGGADAGENGASTTSTVPSTSTASCGSGLFDIDIRSTSQRNTNRRAMTQLMFPQEIKSLADTLCRDAPDENARQQAHGHATTQFIEHMTPEQREAVEEAVRESKERAHAPVTNEIRQEYVARTARSSTS
jgi:hypothetical protein